MRISRCGRHSQRSGGDSASDQESGGKGRQLAPFDLTHVQLSRLSKRRSFDATVELRIRLFRT